MISRRYGAPVVALVALLLLVLPVRGEIIDRVLASVDSVIITQSDVFGAIRLGLVDTGGATDPIVAALARLIERRLTLAEVERYGPPQPTDAQIDARLERITSGIPAARFDEILGESGLTRESLRRHVRDDLRIESYLDQRFGAAIQPSDDEIASYYQQHRDAFTEGGVLRPFDDVRDAARAGLVAERRNAIINEWLAGLRKRANVSVLIR